MEYMSQQNAVVATIDPDAYTAATYTTDGVDMDVFPQCIFIVMVGDMETGSTVDFSITRSTDNSTFVAMSPAKAITQLTAAGTDDDKQVVIHVDAAELGDGYRYCQGSLVIADAASDAAVVAIADHSRYKPATDYDLASVDEIVT